MTTAFMDLRSSVTWERVAEAIGHHPYEYDLSDTSERLDVVQIVLTTLDRVQRADEGSPT